MALPAGKLNVTERKTVKSM